MAPSEDDMEDLDGFESDGVGGQISKVLRINQRHHHQDTEHKHIKGKYFRLADDFYAMAFVAYKIDI